jgi:diguanylate cyclase (GGDEF)-like protein
VAHTSLADAAQAGAGPVAQRVPGDGRMSAPLLLLVEDNRRDADRLKAVLGAAPEGFRVVHVETIDDVALTVDLAMCVLLDLSLAGTEGLDSLHALRELHPTVPVVALVDDANEAHGLLALHEGAQDYLLKSEFGGLRRAIRYAVERRRAEAVLADRDRFQRDILDTLDIATAVVNRAGAIVAANRTWTMFMQTVGADQTRCSVGASYYSVLDEIGRATPEWVRSVSASIREVLGGRDGIEAPTLALSGGIAVRTRVSPLTSGGAVVTHHDISELVAAQAELSRTEIHDRLTGLPNRVLLHNRIEHAIRRSKGGGAAFSVLFLDLDRFKLVNDSLGHDAGDRLLAAVAERLARALTPADTLARFGGDEFVVLTEDATPTTSQVLAVRLRDLLAEPFSLDGQEIVIGASIGIVNCGAGDLDPAGVLRDASTAMYSAKEAGRSRLRVATSELHDAAMLRLDTEAGLRKAIGNEQFVLHFQPEVDARSQALTSVEALVRWDHPERGLLTPAEFLPVAHETGLIVELGSWVLGNALQEAARWRRDVPDAEQLGISVNLASAQLRDLRLLDSVIEALRETNTPPRLLTLEITEDVMLNDSEEILEALHALRSYGVHLSVDDFGTGFSAMAYLCALPVESVKLDPQLSRQAGDSERADTVVRGLVSMCHGLDLIVTAEGVEDPAHAVNLAAMGVDRLQGWHVGRPMDAAAFRATLRSLL